VQLNLLADILEYFCGSLWRNHAGTKQLNIADELVLLQQQQQQ